MRPVSLFAAAFVFVTAANAFADCPITQEEIRATLRAFPAAQAAEKAAKPKEALALYVAAQGPTCDPNPNAIAAATRAAALAGPLAAAAEQRRAWAEAFELYEQGGHYAAADRALMQLLRANQDDVTLVRQHLQHFGHRALPSFAANNRHQIAAAGPYVLDQALRRELEAMPKQGVDRALAKEATLFSDAYLAERMRLTATRPEPSYNNMSAIQATVAAEQAFQQKYPSDPVKASLQQLRLAREWASLSGDEALMKATDAQTLARAEARATALETRYADAPELLEAAADYYRSVDQLTPAAPRLARIAARAMALGDQSKAKGKLTLATAYYRLADADDKAEAIRAEQQQNAIQQAQPSIDAAMKMAEEMKAKFDPATVEAMKKQAEAMRQAIEAARKQR
jgi:hypothetical protein